MKRWRRRAAEFFVVGLVIIAGLAATAQFRQARIDEADAEQRVNHASAADSLSDRAASGVRDSITAAQRGSLLTVAQWPSVEEYATEWDRFTSQLDGAATITTVLEVEQSTLESFVAAERSYIPGYELDMAGAADATGSHLIVARSVDPDVVIGTDLDASSEFAKRLRSLPPSRIDAVLGEPFPEASSASSDVSNESILTLIIRQRAEGPTGSRLESWSIIELDLSPTLANSLESIGEDLGATFVVRDLGAAGSFGAPLTTDSIVEERVASAGLVVLDIQSWLGAKDKSSGLIVATGLAGTAILALLTSLAFGFVAQRRRAGISELDARRDHLTGISNRRWMSEYLTANENVAKTVMFCDLDRFKIVNDSSGHAAGDQMLVEVAQRIENCLDAFSHVARFGGDEFLVVVIGSPKPIEHAKLIASRIHLAFADPFQVGGSEFRTTISIGVAASESTGVGSGEELIRGADVALGLAKQRGRNSTVVYDDRLRAAELDSLGLEQDLQRALDEEAFTVHYQPIVDHDGRLLSHEALVRWDRSGDLLKPDQFLPIVADVGRMADLGAAVLRIALAEFVAGTAGKGATTIHINIDERQLSDDNFATTLAECIDASGIDPARVVLELTEGEWMESPSLIDSTLLTIQKLGVGFSIDDFGSGHSTLARMFSVNGVAEVKLDRSLLRLLRSERDRVFLSGFVRSAQDAGMTVVAEGIETKEDLEAAAAAGVEQFQGYFFCRPQPAEVAFATAGPYPLCGAHSKASSTAA